MKKVILTISSILIIVALPLTILALKYNERLETFAGNFRRAFPYHYKKNRGVNLKFNSFYMINEDNGMVYLANTTTLPRLFIIDTLFKKMDTVDISMQDELLKRKGCSKILLDGNNFYLCYGPEHTILKGDQQTWAAGSSNISPPFFNDAVQIGAGSFVFKYTSSKTNHLALRKVSSKGVSLENDSIFEVQVDGQYCTSGHLRYNKDLNVLIYVYAYRNEILVIDTNLQVLKKFRTIDDIDTVRFTVSKIKSSGSTVITQPTILVNQRCATYKNNLFVHSKIRGKYEDDITFEYSNVIDVYDIIDGRYVYSLRLPNSKKTPLKQLEVFNGNLYTISDRFLNKYQYELPK